MWTAADGMVEGHFWLTPEVGGRLKAVIDAGTQRIFRARRSAGPHEPHEAYAADALADRVLADAPEPEERTAASDVPEPRSVVDLSRAREVTARKTRLRNARPREAKALAARS